MLTVCDDVHDVAVALNMHERVDVNAAGAGHAAKVVTPEVDEHNVLRALLLVGKELCRKLVVLLVISASPAGSRDGVCKAHALAVYTDKHLGARTYYLQRTAAGRGGDECNSCPWPRTSSSRLQHLKIITEV